jgi:hypothetical protein
MPRKTKKDILNLNKSELAEALFDRVSNDDNASDKLKGAMSKTSAGLIVDTIFGVAARYSKEDDKATRKKAVVAGNKKDDKEADGIIANHLLSTKPSGRGSKKAFPKVTIPGFGTFSVAHRKKRTGKHPTTQKKIEIPETHVVTFRAGKSLKAGASVLYK